jgi:hypothetical protein
MGVTGKRRTRVQELGRAAQVASAELPSSGVKPGQERVALTYGCKVGVAGTAQPESEGGERCAQ